MRRFQRRGRKKHPRTTAEKLLMQEFSRQLKDVMGKEQWNVKTLAKHLQVSLASLYNYKNKTDLPAFEVLKRAHDLFGMNFENIDFGNTSGTRVPSESESPRQYVLPFIENVSNGDIQIIRTKPVKPDTLEVTLRIRFAG